MDEKSLKPQLRFKGFADAWEQRKFQDIFSFERPDNYIVRSDKYSNEYTMPVLTANKAFVLGYTKENSPCTKTSLIFDDFTLECKYVDFPYMVKSSAIKILTVKDSKKDNLRFSFERLNTTKIEILGHARHYISVVQPTETRTPEIAEQNKISAFFSNLDNLITLHQRKLDKLSNVKKALLEKMFPKNDSDVPEIRFKGFTDAWEQRKLGDIAQITMGQSPDGATYSDKPSKYILVQGNADLENGWVKPRIWTTQMTKKADAGDLIMSVRAPAGAMGKTAYNVVLGRGVAGIKGNNFLYQILTKMDADGFWKKLSCGSTFESLNSDNIKNAEINISPVSNEQQKIGTFFSNLDNLITLHQRKLEKLKNIKKACLEKMFV